MALRRTKNWDWGLNPDKLSNNYSWDQVNASLLMDIRDELQTLNATMGCWRFRAMGRRDDRTRPQGEGPAHYRRERRRAFWRSVGVAAAPGLRQARGDDVTPTDRSDRAVGDRIEVDETVMSNFDHSIRGDADAELRAGNVFGRHAGWNFNGLVWFENGQFHEQVFCYHVSQKIVSADTLRELMDAVNEEFGSE